MEALSEMSILISFPRLKSRIARLKGIPQMSRSKITVVSILFVLFVPLTAAAVPEHPPREHAVAVNEILAGAADKTGISDLVGAMPFKCFQSADSVEVCEWRLSNRETGWRPLAKAIETLKRVALLCALPTDGSPRLKLSCAARPQASNKALFSVKQIRNVRRLKMSALREVYQRLAQRWIDESLTMVSLSFLLGGVPSDCAPTSGGILTCTWHLDNSDYGHGTVATAVGARVGEKVQLHCELPANGSPRSVEGCEAAVDE